MVRVVRSLGGVADRVKGGQVFIWVACMVSLDDSCGLSKTCFSPCMAFFSVKTMWLS